MSDQKKEYLGAAAGISREFLSGLPPISSKAAKLLFIPLAQNVLYTKNCNDNILYISKPDLAMTLGLSKSYFQEGNINKYISNILTKELFDLKVNGIQIIDPDNTRLSRLWFEFAFTDQAMNCYFQGLTEKYFTISIDTLKKMKNKHTWNIVKELFLNFDFRNGKAQIYKRNTFIFKKVLDINYTTEGTRKFDRSHFEQRCLIPAIEDLRRMEQFKIYNVKSNNLKDNYLGKEYIYNSGEKYLKNYYIGYKIKKIQTEMQEDDVSELIFCDDD